MASPASTSPRALCHLITSSTQVLLSCIVTFHSSWVESQRASQVITAVPITSRWCLQPLEAAVLQRTSCLLTSPCTSVSWEQIEHDWCTSIFNLFCSFCYYCRGKNTPPDKEVLAVSWCVMCVCVVVGDLSTHRKRGTTKQSGFVFVSVCYIQRQVTLVFLLIIMKRSVSQLLKA